MSKFYCPRIKNGIAFTPNRDYDVCSVRDLNTSSKLGISSTSLEDFLNSDYRKNLIAEAETGQWPKGCESCMKDEALGLISSRMAEVKSEKENGTSRLVHFNSGSVCDSDCAMCGPRWSSSIAKRLKTHPDPNKAFFAVGENQLEMPYNNKSLANLKAAIAQADRLKVLGGEPFLDMKLWKLLDKIATKNLELNITTNGNTYPSEYQFNILNKFKTVNFVFSIDGTGLTYEWIRQNLNFKTVVKNFVKLSDQFNKVTALTVVQAHNVLNLKDLDNLFKDKIEFQPLVYPQLLSIRNAPRWTIEQALTETKNNSVIQNILNTSLETGPSHELSLLISHTHYLNGHRTHYFNPDEWKVQIRT